MYTLQAWVKAWVAEAGLKSAARQSHLTSPPFYSPMSRANSTLSLAITFDPEVMMQQLQPGEEVALGS